MAEKLYMTALSPTMEKGTITQWHKKEGEKIEYGDLICEVETDKAVMEYESDFDAVLLKITVQEGQAASVGDTIAVCGEEGEDFTDLLPDFSETEAVIDAAVPKHIPQSESPSAAGNSGQRLKSSPLARKMAESMGIELSAVKGSGWDGRIIKRDIERFTEAASPVSVSAEDRRETVKSPGPMRMAIAERLSASKFSAPHFYLTVQVDASALLRSREELMLRKNIKPSINSYIIKMSAQALMRHPVINSSWNGGNIKQFATADISFAAALDDGLIAPVIRGCENKGISAIDKELKALSADAKAGKLVTAQYSGAGFTVSNLGSFGIEEFTAIINPPGSAILAVGAVIKTPVVVSGTDGTDSMAIRPVMKMTLSCDHRVIDGAVGAAFLADLKNMIEDPLEALM